MKYMALSKTVRELKWVNIFVTNFGFAVQKLLIIYYNNKNTMVFLDTKGTIHYYWIKYIDIKHHYIKKRIENREIKLLYISTSKIIADNLIKLLLALLFVRNIGQLRFIKIIR